MKIPTMICQVDESWKRKERNQCQILNKGSLSNEKTVNEV